MKKFQIKTEFRRIVLLICLVLSSLANYAVANDEPSGKLYDETIFVISNFSGVDANLSEPRTIQELLDQKIGGFRFYLEWEKQQNQKTKIPQRKKTKKCVYV